MTEMISRDGVDISINTDDWPDESGSRAAFDTVEESINALGIMPPDAGCNVLIWID